MSKKDALYNRYVGNKSNMPKTELQRHQKKKLKKRRNLCLLRNL